MKSFIFKLVTLSVFSVVVIYAKGEKLRVGEITPYALSVEFDIIDSQTHDKLEKMKFSVHSVDDSSVVRQGIGPEHVRFTDPDFDKHIFQLRDPKPGSKWILKFRDVNPDDYSGEGNEDLRELYDGILARQGRYKSCEIEFKVPEFDECEQQLCPANGSLPEHLMLFMEMPPVEMEKLP